MPILRSQLVTDRQLARLFACLHAAGLERGDLDEVAAQMGLGDDYKALTRQQYDDLYGAVEILGGVA